MTAKSNQSIQGSLFEEDYLLRTLGRLAYSPEVALTELVANAWDAGASRVAIVIPEKLDAKLTVDDDGCGMNSDDFRRRWMTLGYNRVRHQGVNAEFPPERAEWRRSAYGRNGVGRHGLLCFSSTYQVETWRDGKGSRFVISTASGVQPFVLQQEDTFNAEGHGTRLTTDVRRHLPAPETVLNVLAARFLHDPRFSVFVNGVSVPLSQHQGLIDETTLTITETTQAQAYCIDSSQAARTTQYQGVAFWVGGRLVGEPSWILANTPVIDGRTRIAKRYTVVVRSDDLFEEVVSDWSSFRDSEIVTKLYEVVGDYVRNIFSALSKERIQETKTAVMVDIASDLRRLQPLARMEVRDFVDEVAAQQPMIPPETLSVAVQAVINLEKSRSGAPLLEKLAKLTEEDVEGLNRLLSEWSVRDALTVLDEIDRRLAVIEAIRTLSSDPAADELHTLHPLVTQARWLFGPEFDSPEYAMNASLKSAVLQVFGKRAEKGSFINEKRRPDLIVWADATLSAVATETFDEHSNLVRFRDVLLIELKRGDSTIDRDNVHQATDYVEDLLNCGLLEGSPFIRAFVVGHRASGKIEDTRKIGESPERARIQVATFDQLVRTGEKRLFTLRDRLTERYEEVSGVDLLGKAVGAADQLSLPKSEGSSSATDHT